MLRDEPSDERQNSAGNTTGRNCRSAADCGSENSRITSVPPGRSTRTISRHADAGCSTLRMPNPIVAASTVASRNGMRVASPRIERQCQGRATFAFPIRSIARGEIDADDAPRAPLPGHRGQRQIGGAGAQVEHGLAARQLQRLDGALSPLLVEPRAEQMIQKVVSRRQSRRTFRKCATDPSLARSGIAGIGDRDASNGRHTPRSRSRRNTECRRSR